MTRSDSDDDESDSPCHNPEPRIRNRGMQHVEHDPEKHEAGSGCDGEHGDVRRFALRGRGHINGSQRHRGQKSKNRDAKGAE
jgi:hypothetical protein